MYELYLVCFLVGATLMVGQFLLGLLGFGHHDGDGHDAVGHDISHDVHHDGHGHGHGDDAHGNWFVGVLTFRSIVAALTFFGLVGLSLRPYITFPYELMIAVAAGVGVLYLVAFLMRSLHQLKAEGNVRIENAVGKEATVYVAIPGHKKGMGKVMLKLQNRTVECQARTNHADLPTGSKVVVVAVISADTLEVKPLETTGSPHHA